MNFRIFSRLFFVSILFFLFFSCTSVKEERLLIRFMSNAESSENAMPDSYESKASAGDKIDLKQIGFPIIRYRDKDYYGYKKSGKYYRLDSVIVNDKEEYLFQIDQTGKIMNTSMGLPAGGVILNPIYVSFDSSSASTEDDLSVPGVRFSYNYQSTDGSLANPDVVRVDFTAQQIRDGVTMDSLGLTPTKLHMRGRWNRYDRLVDGRYQDCLFFGYVDPSEHNKAYYYNEMVTDPNDKSGTIVRTHFRYRDLDTGRIFTESDRLDVTKVSRIVPDYIPAGYRPVQDSFGSCTYNNGTTTENINLKMDMVFIPGSYNSSWPYEQTNFASNDVFCSVFIAPQAAVNTSLYRDDLTDNRQFHTTDMLVSDMIITRDFLYKLLYCKPNVVTVEGNQVHVSDGSNSRTYTFSNSSILSYDTASSTSGLSYYQTANIPWSYPDYIDCLIMANLLTHLYNIANPSNPLTYVYYYTSTSGGTGVSEIGGEQMLVTSHLTQAAVSASIELERKLIVQYPATGYRLPKNHEFSYFARIITDERQVPSISSIPSSLPDVKHGLILDKDLLGLKYYFHTVNDSGYYDGTDSSEWLGDCAGLALYNHETGTYDPILRHSYQGMGRRNATAIAAEHDSQKYGYIWDDTEPSTDGVFDDFNTRNGAGLYNLFGSRYQYIYAGYDPSSYTRGSAYNCTANSSRGRLFLITKFATSSNSEYYRGADTSVRFCRSL